MGFFDKIKEKFHHDKENTKNRLLETENNKQQFGVPTDDSPRNRMMDTVSNEQGAMYAQRRDSPGAPVLEPPKKEEKNLLYHSLSNEQADKLSKGIPIGDDNDDDGRPKNKLLDVNPNDGITDNNVAGDVKLNSDRLL